MKSQIEVKCTIKNGSLLTEANAHKISVTSVKGDFHGHRVGTDIDTENYTPRYSIIKEDQGWIAREVTFNTGLLGHTPTLREQIIRIGLNGKFKIEVED